MQKEKERERSYRDSDPQQKKPKKQTPNLDACRNGEKREKRNQKDSYFAAADDQVLLLRPCTR